MRRLASRWWFGIALALASVLLAPAVPHAHADGGAPNLAYVVGVGPGIAVIDIAQRHVTGTIAVGGDPQTILLSLDGRSLYVTQPALGGVAVIAARTGQTTCTAHLSGHPALLALSTDATVLYAAGGEGTISAIDPTTCAVQRTFETHDRVYGLAITAITIGNTFSDQLWVAGTNAITIFDEQGRQLGDIPLAGGPQSLCIPSGLTAYVTKRQGTVVAVDVATHQVSPPLLTGGQFGLMDYDALTLEIYVPDQKAHRLEVLAPFIVGAVLPPHEPARVMRLGGAPQAVTITSDGQLGFVALAGGKVAMLDLPGRQLVTTIAVGGTPHFIITGLYPPPGSDIPPKSPAPPTVSPILGPALVLLSLVAAILLVSLLLSWKRWRS